MLGILGGMGPSATVDLMNKIIGATAAEKDQDHIPMIVSSVPQIPDRTEAIMGKGEDPLPAMLRCIFMLERAGATLIAIPCNTAHFWYPQLTQFARVTILNIVDACADELPKDGKVASRIGLLATRGTVAAGIYEKRLVNYEIVLPDEPDEVMAGISAIKGGRFEEGRDLLANAADKLILNRACEAVILACTEIPIALAERVRASPAIYIDPTAALARNCVRHWREISMGGSPMATKLIAGSAHMSAGSTCL